jgi:hypothetical protein
MTARPLTAERLETASDILTYRAAALDAERLEAVARLRDRRRDVMTALDDRDAETARAETAREARLLARVRHSAARDVLDALDADADGIAETDARIIALVDALAAAETLADAERRLAEAETSQRVSYHNVIAASRDRAEAERLLEAAAEAAEAAHRAAYTANRAIHLRAMIAETMIIERDACAAVTAALDAEADAADADAVAVAALDRAPCDSYAHAAREAADARDAAHRAAYDARQRARAITAARVALADAVARAEADALAVLEAANL